MKNKINYIFVLALFVFSACDTEENEFDKQVFPFTNVVGEYVVDIDLSQPFEASDHVTVVVTSTSKSNGDSLWIEDHDFFESKVRVARSGNTFSITEGNDIVFGEVVNISGEVFPAQDSIHIEWRYLQMTGDPADDFVIVANGELYNGITN